MTDRRPEIDQVRKFEVSGSEIGRQCSRATDRLWARPTIGFLHDPSRAQNKPFAPNTDFGPIDSTSIVFGLAVLAPVGPPLRRISAWLWGGAAVAEGGERRAAEDKGANTYVIEASI